MSDTKLVEVYRALNSIDALLFQDALEAAGISARITEQSVAALDPNLWWAAPRILVAEADAAKAVAIVREVEKSLTRKPRSHR